MVCTDSVCLSVCLSASLSLCLPLSLSLSLSLSLGYCRSYELFINEWKVEFVKADCEDSGRLGETLAQVALSLSLPLFLLLLLSLALSLARSLARARARLRSLPYAVSMQCSASDYAYLWQVWLPRRALASTK